MRAYVLNRKLGWLSGFVTMAALGWGASNQPVPILSLLSSPAPPWAELPRVVVRRADLCASLLAGGQVDSSEKTLIKCELENLAPRTGARGPASGGSSTILDLVPDGTLVRQGEVICRLDASEYEEMVRHQEIQVGQARADRTRAELDLGSAELALHEYRDGVLVQQRQNYEGSIALARADLRRQQDRVAWALRMRPLGYIAPAKVETERHLLLQAELSLARLEREYANFGRLVGPNTERTLIRRVESARAALDFQVVRQAQQEKRLETLRRQVELCTVRAPHDGLVVYARPSDDGARVMVGASVRQKQDLFYLPDLRHMEVQTVLHETVVPRVRAGMPVWVRVEALSDRTLPGRVVSISPLPLPRSRRSSPDVRNYRARVVLDEAPAALRPGMSAAVAIETNRRPGALVIPRDAVAGVSGRDVCYVAGPRGLERRRVAIGTAERDLLEVTAGLAEGEEVVLVPARPEALAALDSAAIEVEESGGASPSPVVVVGGQTPEFDSTRESTPADERDKPAPGPQAGE